MIVKNTKLLELLESQLTFPTHYMHKVIGKNSEKFLAAVAALLKTTVRLSVKSKKETANQAHVSITLELHAHSAHEVVFLIERSQQLTDVLYVL
ncbi:MAG: DUF493 family protein [Xanthomonadaceae bacterium]|nr:DUF493 family protein [Xanthomonadaceae bacterium]